MSIEFFDVLIIGAGVSGIGMACTLKTHCADKSFAILERRNNLGGTWDLFRYPGVRSDSDMLTYGFQFKPWDDFKILADGSEIQRYLADTAREHEVNQRIRYGLKIISADWSATQQHWVVTALEEASGQIRSFRCSQLVMSTGYYNYDAGYVPEFPGMENFAGKVVHPQHWPQDLDYAGKRVVIVGSGATAITLVPAMAKQAAHVTMLQRSPTYIMSIPSDDALTRTLSYIMPRRWAFAMARRRNTTVARWVYQACRKWPEKMRKFLLQKTAERLNGSADMRHFTPSYLPWDQRVCIVPDEDLFAAIRSTKASVETDLIDGFAGNKLLLRSGAELEADIVVMATGLDIQLFGGMRITVNGLPYAPSKHMLYKGVLMENLPNFSWILGYTNASWTLKADLSAAYLCRLFNYLDEHHYAVATPCDRVGCKMGESVMGGLTSGYISRAQERMPRQGRKMPWATSSHYPSDKVMLLRDPIDDGILDFERCAENVDAA